MDPGTGSGWCDSGAQALASSCLWETICSWALDKSRHSGSFGSVSHQYKAIRWIVSYPKSDRSSHPCPPVPMIAAWVVSSGQWKQPCSCLIGSYPVMCIFLFTENTSSLCPLLPLIKYASHVPTQGPSPTLWFPLDCCNDHVFQPVSISHLPFLLFCESFTLLSHFSF